MSNYSVDEEIYQLFSQATATRAECDGRALELVGGPAIVPVSVQGVCSYTVYAGPNFEYVVQFRLKSLNLPSETTRLARDVYGHFAPEVTEHGQLGASTVGDTDKSEPLLVYVMSRIKGISHLGFILAHGYPENSPDNMVRRKTLMADVARFFALSWKAPQSVSEEWHDSTRSECRHELDLLLGALPERFHPVIQQTIEALPSIQSLPVVLLHKDFGSSNIILDEPDCHLVGVVDWAEAALGMFGSNLHSLLPLYGKVMLNSGVTVFEDNDLLQETFWDVLSAEVGDLSADQVRAIKAARTLGLLRSKGFTSRLNNMPQPQPISDDDAGRYNMMYLDGLLLRSDTKFT